MGRPFAPDENRDGQDDVVVISHGLWQRRFGGDMGILARTGRLDNRVYRVVGVMPEGFQAPSDARGSDPVDVLAPLVVPPEVLTNRQDHEVDVIGGLAPGVSLE